MTTQGKKRNGSVVEQGKQDFCAIRCRLEVLTSDCVSNNISGASVVIEDLECPGRLLRVVKPAWSSRCIEIFECACGAQRFSRQVCLEMPLMKEEASGDGSSISTVVEIHVGEHIEFFLLTVARQILRQLGLITRVVVRVGVRIRI